MFPESLTNRILVQKTDGYDAGAAITVFITPRLDAPLGAQVQYLVQDSTLAFNENTSLALAFNATVKTSTSYEVRLNITVSVGVVMINTF
jgi:hypothetical protein